MQTNDSPQPLRDDDEAVALAACYRLLLGLVRRRPKQAEPSLADDTKANTAEQTLEIKNGAGVRQDKTSTAPSQSATYHPKE